MRHLSLGGGWLALLLAVTACGGLETPPERPSLLLLTLDTTRADRLESYGAPPGTTPSLLALAEAGVVFERAYAATPVTLPSHASLFSGLDPPRHGVRNNGMRLAAAEQPLLAEVLRGEGLRTAAFVSAAVLDERFGLGRGFELYDDDLAAGAPRAARLIAERPAAATIDAAVAWLDILDSDERFFLWVHLFEPHAAYTPPPPFAERFRERPYDGEVAAMDQQIGRLLAHRRIVADPVLVMAVGDHGESLGEHGEETHAMLAYDATLRVPWIVRAPGIAAGRRIAAPVSHVDLLPTALELLEVALPDGVELSGESLAPALRGVGAPPAERPLYGESLVAYETYGWAPLHALRMGRWKLLRGVRSELFDTQADPGELRDLARLEARTVNRLEGLLSLLLARPAAASANDVTDRETEARLRSLGYLSGSGAAAERRQRPDPRELIGTHLAFERAAHDFHRRDLGRALPELEAVLDRDPENLAALVMLAGAFSELGRHDEARELAERSVRLAPQDAGARLARGVVEARADDLEEALSSLQEALALDPGSFEARLEIGLLLFRLERRDKAVATLRSLLADDPSNSRALIAMAERVDIEAGRVAAAERSLREVLGRDPSRIEGWRVLGSLLEDTARPQEAIAVYRQGLEQVPGDGKLHARLGLALGRLGQTEEAEASLLRARELLRPGSAAVHSALAGLHLRRGEWANAAGEARRAVQLDPTLAPAWNNLGAAQEEQGSPESALESYDRALAVAPGFWQAQFNRALLLRLGGRWQEAAEGYQAVLDAVPGHAKSHFELGVLYLGPLADRAAAERHLSAAIEAEPDHARAAEARRLLDG